MLGMLFGIDAEDPGLEHGELLAYLDKSLTGFLRESYDDGSIKHLSRYVDGERVAAYKWYPGGKRAFVKIYRAGKRHTEHVDWWPNGEVKYSRVFVNGIQQGEAIASYRDGTPETRFNYVDGKQRGRQQLWNSDGSVRANFVMTATRRYGLIGEKVCNGGPSDRAEL
jgi:antitoxin component YwqK of YwqJK toxin-antitoxin module